MPDLQQLKDHLKALCKDKPVLVVILISAVLVTAVRVATPFRLGKDQAIQLEASQRLVNGQGLTTTKAYPRDSNDVLIAPSSKYLTDWPPGLSLLVATFLYAGISLLISLKILYAIITLSGWIGWAMIACSFISRPVNHRKTVSWVYLIGIALLPIIATPNWEGTDIFLWTGIPYVFICLIGIDRKQPSLLSIACAGFLFGCLIAIRFTSLFLGFAALLILFQVSYPHIKVLFNRCLVFVFSTSIIAVPTTIYLMLYAEPVRSVAVNVPEVRYNSIVIKDILRNLYVTSNLVLGHPLLELVIRRLNRDWLTYVAGLICLTVVLAWPVFLRQGASKVVKAKHDVALSLSFLPVSMAVFLIAVALYIGAPDFIQVRRYYEVLSLCAIFIFYEIATRRNAVRVIKLASKGVLVSFILYFCVIVPALAYSDNRRHSANTNTRVGANSGMFKLYTPRENSRIKVEELYRDNPDALFYAHYYQWFTYDGFDRLPTPGINMRAMPKDDFWSRAYASKPVKIFWVVDQRTTLDFVPDFNKRLIFSDPNEEMKILVSDFSSGPLVSEQIARKNE